MATKQPDIHIPTNTQDGVKLPGNDGHVAAQPESTAATAKPPPHPQSMAPGGPIASAVRDATAIHNQKETTDSKGPVTNQHSTTTNSTIPHARMAPSVQTPSPAHQFEENATVAPPVQHSSTTIATGTLKTTDDHERRENQGMRERTWLKDCPIS